MSPVLETKDNSFSLDLQFDDVHMRLVNNLMQHGKKNKATTIVNRALEQGFSKSDAVSKEQFLLQSVANVLPFVETRSVRVGGSALQVPTPLTETRSKSLAVKWIVGASRKRSERGMASKLASELSMAYKQQGNAVRKRDDVHKQAEANRAYSNRSW